MGTHLTSATSSGTALALRMRTLLPLKMDRLNSAVTASFRPRGVPFRSKSTRCGIAPASPIVTLQSSITERLNRVAAAASLAPPEDHGLARTCAITRGLSCVVLFDGIQNLHGSRGV